MESRGGQNRLGTPDEKPEAGAGSPGFWQWPARPAGPEQSALGRALVAGLLWEIFLENPSLREAAGPARQHLKARLQKTLACRLAGRMPLASFQDLIHGFDYWFEALFPLMAEVPEIPSGAPPNPRTLAGKEGSFRDDLVREALAETPGLLPHRRHRKLDAERLLQFFQGTQGDWFRLRDLERFFQVDRKTAWEYVKKLLQAGLLVHNQGQSRAVRYRLASRFFRSEVASCKGAPSPAETH